MGYPKKYVGHYKPLAEWLSSLGHLVYPYEMWCEPVIVKDEKASYNIFSGKTNVYETHNLYGLVDVVSYYRMGLWAWEYKSKGDDVLRGVKQVKNYTRSFNFVCLVVEDLAMMDRFVKGESKHVREILEDLNVGVCWNNEGVFEIIRSAESLEPDVFLNRALIDRFHRVWTSRLKHPPKHPKLCEDEQNTKLTNFFPS